MKNEASVIVLDKDRKIVRVGDTVYSGDDMMPLVVTKIEQSVDGLIYPMLITAVHFDKGPILRREKVFLAPINAVRFPDLSLTLPDSWEKLLSDLRAAQIFTGRYYNAVSLFASESIIERICALREQDYK